MIMGLSEGQAKMSKSDPESAIFMEDTVVSGSFLSCYATVMVNPLCSACSVSSASFTINAIV